MSGNIHVTRTTDGRRDGHAESIIPPPPTLLRGVYNYMSVYMHVCMKIQIECASVCSLNNILRRCVHCSPESVSPLKRLKTILAREKRN
jgi:hypothetical protein